MTDADFLTALKIKAEPIEPPRITTWSEQTLREVEDDIARFPPTTDYEAWICRSRRWRNSYVRARNTAIVLFLSLVIVGALLLRLGAGSR